MTRLISAVFVFAIAISALLWTIPATGQNPGVSIQTTTTAPSGSCGNPNIRYRVPNGTLYTCQSGTWGVVGPGTVTSIATTSPITGGTITGIGTIACATCTTSAASLTSNAVVIGGGGQAESTISASTTPTHALFATAGSPAFRAITAADIPVSSVFRWLFCQSGTCNNETTTGGIPVQLASGTITLNACYVLYYGAIPSTTITIDVRKNATSSGTGSSLLGSAWSFSTATLGTPLAFGGSFAATTLASGDQVSYYMTGTTGQGMTISCAGS